MTGTGALIIKFLLIFLTQLFIQRVSALVFTRICSALKRTWVDLLRWKLIAGYYATVALASTRDFGDFKNRNEF